MEKNKNYLVSTEAALEIVAQYLGRGITKPTLIKWVKENNLGHQCVKGSRWLIDRNKLIKLLEKGKA